MKEIKNVNVLTEEELQKKANDFYLSDAIFDSIGAKNEREVKMIRNGLVGTIEYLLNTSNDEELVNVLKLLINEYQVSLALISKLSKVTEKEIHDFLHQQELEVEKKYALLSVCQYLRTTIRQYQLILDKVE